MFKKLIYAFGVSAYVFRSFFFGMKRGYDLTRQGYDRYTMLSMVEEETDKKYGEGIRKLKVWANV